MGSRAQGTVFQSVGGSKDVGNGVGKIFSSQSIQSILSGDEAATCRGQAGKLRRQAAGVPWLLWVIGGEGCAPGQELVMVDHSLTQRC